MTIVKRAIKKETKITELYRKWDSETARAGSGSTHLTSNLEPFLRASRVCDTSRSHLTRPHCSLLGQPASRQDTGPRARGTRAETALTFLSRTRVHIKYYDAVTFATIIANSRLMSRPRLVPLSVFLSRLQRNIFAVMVQFNSETIQRSPVFNNLSRYTNI